ncbi:winged helix-turn-helix domain-containing protein [Actinoplanes sp. NPDC051633]|uniref:winged helix-turn-helix domain-containing protein n=1 Tax=Actinoplanes sp. NPDC051633 TaxID=3155670 RepID=UPI003431A16C
MPAPRRDPEGSSALAGGSAVASNTAPAALTLTITIPITDEAMSPQAERLIEAVRELAAAGGQVSEPVPAPFTEPVSDGPEVRLLTASRRVLVDGLALPLTRLEFELLQFLAGNPRRVFSRAQLLTGVWGYEHTGERTVDVHVRRLRLKLGPQVPLITTVYGVGYRLADDARVVVVPHE